jgi:hypothetical protein
MTASFDRRMDAPGAPATRRCTVRRGVALYSYQEECITGQMTLEDCLREAADIGAYGIELLPESLVPEFPNPSAAWIERWHRWMETFGTVPACYTQFIDTMRSPTHNLSVAEGVETMLRDIRLAKLLGIPRIRCLMGTPLPILEATLPHLDREDIWLGVELHAPINLHGRLVERFLQLAERTDRFGFVPDLGIFQTRPNPYLRERAIRDGRLTAEIAEYIESSWTDGVGREQVLTEVSRMRGPSGSSGYVEQLYRLAPQNPADLLSILPKCRHIHGKTWGLTEDCVDPAINLSEVIPVLVEGGFDGYIATEYEGQRFVQDVHPFSEVEMVRRQHVALRRLLGED